MAHDILKTFTYARDGIHIETAEAGATDVEIPLEQGTIAALENAGFIALSAKDSAPKAEAPAPVSKKDKLLADYEAKFGEPAPWNISLKTLKARLAE